MTVFASSAELVPMLAERQINYLFHDRINGILPPFVNMGVLGLNYGLQASHCLLYTSLPTIPIIKTSP